MVICWLKGVVLKPFLGSAKRRFDAMNWRDQSGFNEMYDRYFEASPDQSKRREMEALMRFLVLQRRESVDRELRRGLGGDLQAVFSESENAIVLEILSVHGAYDLIAQLSVQSQEFLVTTLAPPSRDQSQRPASKDRLTVLPLEAKESLSVAEILAGEKGPDFREGIGGDFDGIDGGAEFLQVKLQGEVRAVATRNLSIAASLPKSKRGMGLTQKTLFDGRQSRRSWIGVNRLMQGSRPREGL